MKIVTVRTTNLKKYYDVFNDRFICVPPIPKAIVDYSLIEEASKHYGTSEEEFPLEYTAVLRTAASMTLDEEIDYDYVDKLALDIKTINAEDWSTNDDAFDESHPVASSKEKVLTTDERGSRIEKELRQIIAAAEEEELEEP